MSVTASEQAEPRGSLCRSVHTHTDTQVRVAVGINCPAQLAGNTLCFCTGLHIPAPHCKAILTLPGMLEAFPPASRRTFLPSISSPTFYLLMMHLFPRLSKVKKGSWGLCVHYNEDKEWQQLPPLLRTVQPTVVLATRVNSATGQLHSQTSCLSPVIIYLVCGIKTDTPLFKHTVVLNWGKINSWVQTSCHLSNIVVFPPL